MNLVKNPGLSVDVEVASEYLYLPPEAGLQVFDLADFPENRADRIPYMRQVAEEAVALMGLDGTLRTGDGNDDFVPKLHEAVAQRDAAVAEQFFHVDVATNGFTGILMVGIEGEGPDSVPETQFVNNDALLDRLDFYTRRGPLRDSLSDILVVRPYLDPQDRSAWMEYPRHVLSRLVQAPFKDMLTPAQLEHAESATKDLAVSPRYDGDVFVSKLLSESVVDGSPLITCGVGSREIRLALEGEAGEEELTALEDLHKEITKYLLKKSVDYKSQRVLKGSALLIPLDQLHRAVPYDPTKHKRSAVGVRFYPEADQDVPTSWQKADGTIY